MRKYKLTTQAFISSIISIVLCSVMLIGTTFAWYTDGAKVNVEGISAGEFRKEPAAEEPTTEKETATEPSTESTTVKETTTEKETTESTTEKETTESITEKETTTESVSESTTDEETSAESTTEPITEETTTVPITEPTTEPITEPTTQDETTTEPTTKASAEESKGFFTVIEGDEYDSDSDVFIEGETVEARAVAGLKAEINMLFLTGISADVDDVIVIEDGASAEIISFSNCDFTLPADGKIISINGDSDIQVVLGNVTVNGEKITDENYSQYLTGIKNVIFMSSIG